MSGWGWLALLGAAVGIVAAVIYAAQGFLAEAYLRGHAKGFEEGFEAGVFEARRTVRTHSTADAKSAVQDGRKKGRRGQA